MHVPQEACCAIARAWTAYIDALARNADLEENDLVELSVQLATMLSTVASAYIDAKKRGQIGGHPELGHGLSTGELPIAQACVLYILRVGVFRRLSESGHRQLADRLGVLLASVVGKHVPVGVVGLEGECIVSLPSVTWNPRGAYHEGAGKAASVEAFNVLVCNIDYSVHLA